MSKQQSLSISQLLIVVIVVLVAILILQLLNPICLTEKNLNKIYTRTTKMSNSPSRNILGVTALSSGVIEHLFSSTVGEPRASFRAQNK